MTVEDPLSHQSVIDDSLPKVPQHYVNISGVTLEDPLSHLSVIDDSLPRKPPSSLQNSLVNGRDDLEQSRTSNHDLVRFELWNAKRQSILHRYTTNEEVD